ncbi:ABC transporter permease subunit [Halobellus limi]|uniref:Amino acid/amide ABC transporter membrane protein 2, HAAT family n=1 Tax=Halobellus limi TaxID=699433 RepID=A0A1H5WSY1_9EURY|nr:urea ABC transporter permease [Halobellus limi]QCC46346.1 urea ABC transporter permease [Halobellus limi]SEG02602.1 amino acid/amide ABC transporter membrane protein 2, HAAT family [Halobellus limi]
MSAIDAFDRLRDPLEGPNTIGNSRGFWIGFAVALGAAVVYPLIVGSYQAGNTALFLLYGVLALSLSIVWGYTGVLSFGQVVFLGFAGYTFGIVTLNVDSTLGIMAAIPIAVAIATLVAFLLGYFMFYGRVTGVFVTIITLVSTIVMATFMAQTAGSEWAIGDAALGGFNGMPGIPNIALGIGEAAMSFSGETFYWLVLAVLVASYLGLRILVNGRFGYAMVGVREDEDRVEMLGYDVRRVKLAVFTLGGALAGLSGVLYASWGNYIDPSVFSLAFATFPVVWVTVGGRESLLGAVLATVAIEWFRQQLAITGSEYALVVVGLLLLGVVLFLPEGIVPYVHRKGVAFVETHGEASDEIDDATAGAREEVQ